MCKKVIFLVVLVLGFALAPAMGVETSLLSDSFESEPWDVNWDANTPDWIRSAGDGNSRSGDYAALSTGDDEGDLICDLLDTSGASIVKLDFWFYYIGVDYDEFRLRLLEMEVCGRKLSLTLQGFFLRADGTITVAVL